MVSDEKVGKVAGVWKGEWGGGGVMELQKMGFR